MAKLTQEFKYITYGPKGHEANILRSYFKCSECGTDNGFHPVKKCIKCGVKFIKE